MNQPRTSRQMATRAAEILKEGFVVIDLETTGLSHHPRVEIIEVAILSHTGETLLDTLVKPQWPIPLQASRINGIYDHDVLTAPPFPEVYPFIAEHLNGQQVVAYNYLFEQSILEKVCTRHQKPLIQPKSWQCAMRGYQTFRSLPTYARLTSACFREELAIKNAHRAMGDCVMTLALIHKMAESA